MVAAIGGLEAAECDVRIYFGGGKGTALESGRCGEGRRGMEGAESDTGIDGPRYAGLDICDAQMGE